MMKNKIYETSGYLYNDGDIPMCNYCDKHIHELHDEGLELHDTPYSGIHCCNDVACAVQLVEEGDTFEIIDNDE